jgi:hypothetical protein
MSDNDNILDRLRQNRHRAAVPNRDDTLVSQSPQPQSEPANQTDKPDKQEKETTNQDTQETTSNDATLEELKAELAKFPSTRRHSAIVLEEETDQKLTRFCKERGVTVEVFLEAAWQITSAEPALLEQILAEAKRRYDARKEAGRLRRLITMLSRRT